MNPRNSTLGIMAEDSRGEGWRTLWLAVAMAGMIGVILGYEHQWMTVIVGALLMSISKDESTN